MDELIKRMLAISPRFSPIHRTRLIGDPFSFTCHMLAIALHRQLLQIGGKTLEVLVVRKDCHGLRTEEIDIPDGEQTHEGRQIFGNRRGAKVLVDLTTAVEHRMKMIGSDS